VKIITLNPPYFSKFSRSQRSPAVIKSGVMYYPIWLAYATGVLEQDGFEVKLIDAPASKRDLPTVLDDIMKIQPDLVVIDTSTPSIHNDVTVAEAIKDKIPGVIILLVGPHVSALPEESLKMSPAIDAVAINEYDYTVRDLARALVENNDLSSVLGLCFRDRGGSIVRNASRPLITDLDQLPFVSQVYKRHLRIEDYFYSIARYPEVAIVTGRGCPYQCTYCVWPQTLLGHGYRKRSVKNVADEFEYIAREFTQVKEVFIEDDTLTVDQKRAIGLADELIKRKNRLPFTANSRADVTYETLATLKRAGLRLICVGFESGDQKVLDGMKKNISVDQYFKFREATRKAGVLVHGCFMAGNLGETKETLDKTLHLAKKLDPDTAQFFPIMIYPGTEAYQWASANGFIITQDFHDWLAPEGLHRSIVSTDQLTADELVEWCDLARMSFYLRPRFIAAKVWEAITNPAEAVRIIKAGRVFIKYLFRPSLIQAEK
jgi:radical SAM superfamily enzyme YgiQ (UPF0313 family)